MKTNTLTEYIIFSILVAASIFATGYLIYRANRFDTYYETQTAADEAVKPID